MDGDNGDGDGVVMGDGDFVDGCTEFSAEQPSSNILGTV